jgi:hypothetical protein
MCLMIVQYLNCNILYLMYCFSKQLICADFGLDSKKCTLFRVDHFEEPSFPLRRETMLLTKACVVSGDLLILKNDD